MVRQETQRNTGTDHRPLIEAILDHELLDKWAVDLTHMVMVLCFIETWLAVSADCPAEQMVGRRR